MTLNLQDHSFSIIIESCGRLPSLSPETITQGLFFKNIPELYTSISRAANQICIV